MYNSCEPPAVISERSWQLLQQGDVLVSRVWHCRSLVGKIINSKYVRRWESHYMVLGDDCLSSRSGGSYLSEPVSLGDLREVCLAGCHDDKAGHCVRLSLPDSVIVIQAGSVTVQQQWLHSINWKRRMYHYKQSLLAEVNSSSSIISNVKDMLKLCKETSLRHEYILQYAISIISTLLSQVDMTDDQESCHQLVELIAPLFERVYPPASVCRFLSGLCVQSPSSDLIDKFVLPVVISVLKRNADFSKNVPSREMVQHFLEALAARENHKYLLKDIIDRIHGKGSVCPHPRLLPNLVATCLRAIFKHQAALCCSNQHLQSKTVFERVNSSRSAVCQTDDAPDVGFDRRITFIHQRRSQSLDYKDVNSSPLSDSGCSEGSIQSGDDQKTREDDSTECRLHDLHISSSSDSSPKSGEVSSKSRHGGERKKHLPSLLIDDVEDNVADDSNSDVSSEEECVDCSHESCLLEAQKLHHFLTVIKLSCRFADWRLPLSALLQPIPFPDAIITSQTMTRSLIAVVRSIGLDPRCEVHRCVLPTREGRRSWLQLVCPSSSTAPDEGQLWTTILEMLLACCCGRKGFVRSLVGSLGACQIMSLRSNSTCQKILCSMLEWDLLEKEDKEMSISALVSTQSGSQMYQTLSNQLQQLQYLQSEGGPHVVSLPCRSTDCDLGRFLSGGRLGNLHTLSLAFTSVTSHCARHLIKLPNLISLNLWSTQFGDAGVFLIVEHLLNLESLNLCETFVTDKSIITIAGLKRLRRLNLNSVTVCADTVEHLTRSLPMLKHIDVRYTDAW